MTAPDDGRVFDSFHRQRRRSLLKRRGPVAAILAIAVVAATWGIVTHPPAPPAASAAMNMVLASQPVVAAPPGVVVGVDGSIVTPGSGQDAGGAGGGAGGAGSGADAGDSDAGGSAADPAADPAGAADSGGEGAAGAGGAGDPATEGNPAGGDPAVGGSASGDGSGQPAAARPQQNYSITVATKGFQAELDECQWVRMDVEAVAPIVGAHNFCHGDIVLQMQPGDLVSIAGTGLDGDYQVTGSRDAHAGDNAAQATAGLTADLLLQTCYWGNNGLRLVTLRQVDLSLPPVVVDSF